MRRQLSLLMLVSRSQLYRVLAILAAMAAVQLGLGLRGIQSLSDYYGYYVELVLKEPQFRWTAALAMMAIFASCGALGRRGGRSDYTWYRLPVSNVARTVWPMAAGVLIFLLVWAVQLVVAIGVVLLYGRLLPEHFHQQTLFLAAYRVDYLHALLPLEDGLLWIVTVFRYVGLGIYGGIAMIRSRRSKRTIFPFVSVIAMTLFVGTLGTYEWDIIGVGILWFMVFVSVTHLPGPVEDEDDEEEETP